MNIFRQTLNNFFRKPTRDEFIGMLTIWFYAPLITNFSINYWRESLWQPALFIGATTVAIALFIKFFLKNITPQHFITQLIGVTYVIAGSRLWAIYAPDSPLQQMLYAVLTTVVIIGAIIMALVVGTVIYSLIHKPRD